MNADSPVQFRKTLYRGASSFQLSWLEGGEVKELSFENEGEAIVMMAQIEQRLQLAEMAGKGLTVNPFGEGKPFITSKDVHFAALRLRPRGLAFRDAIEGYVAAAAALQGSGVSVAEAARQFAEANRLARPFDVSLEQALFEWAELKKQVGDTPLFEVLRVYLKHAAATPAEGGAGAGEAGKSAG